MARAHGCAGTASRKSFFECKKKPLFQLRDSGFLGYKLGDDLLSHGTSHTTIGAKTFHF